METVDPNSVIAGTVYRASGFDASNEHNDSFLNIVVSPKCISYAIKDDSGRLLYFKPFQSSGINSMPELPRFLNSAFDFDEIIKKSFRTVTVALHTGDFCLFPVAVSTPDNGAAWSQAFATDKTAGMLVYRDRMAQYHADLLFTFPESVKSSLDRYFTDYRLMHSLYKPLAFLQKQGTGERVFLLVHGGSLNVVAFRSERLLYAGHFSFEHAEDFLYFVAAIYRELSFDPEKIPAILYGEVVRESALYQLLYRYVRNLEMGPQNPQTRMDENYPLPAHFYFHLLCI